MARREQKLRYDDFADRIELEPFYEEIGWEPLDQDARGNDYGYCPWPDNHSHGDTTGKFAIHREKLVYNCYVCGGGSLLSLVMELYNYDVDDATAFLYEFAHGDSRSDGEFIDGFMAYFEDVEARVNTLPFFNERVLERFEPVPDWYLEERGIIREVADEFKVSFTEFNIKKPPMRGEFAEDEPYSGPAIIFPHIWKDRLVGWQNRWLEDDETRPPWCKKYTNTTGFPKENTVYGFDLVLGAVEPVIVSESVPTVLFLLSLGYPAVATFGSGVNSAQMRLLRRFSTGVILARDSDKAGVKWEQANTEYLKRFVPVWHLPPVKGKLGADLGDFASSSNPDKAVKDYLARAIRPELDF